MNEVQVNTAGTSKSSSSFCSQCGAAVPENTPFCPHCGTPIAAPKTSAQRSSPTTSSDSKQHTLDLLKKILPITQIAVGGILFLFFILCIDWDWGYISLFSSIGFLATGIIALLTKS